MCLYYDVPVSRGVENALKRARQLCEMAWCPVRPVPSVLQGVKGSGQEHFYGEFPAWLPQKGVPYSSCRTIEKYIGWNVSPETFLTALQNPHSVVYTRSLAGTPGARANCCYGAACSTFVCYALDMPYRIACKDWLAMGTFQPVDTDCLDCLRLCDVVLDPKHHIAMITGIGRDETGAVQKIVVSEATMPLTVSTAFTPREFRHYWLENGYSVYRYDRLEQVGDAPELYVPGSETFALLPDFGNKANYRVADEPVELWALEEGWETVEVTDPAGDRRCYPLEDGRVVLRPAVAGRYSACLVKAGARSGSVCWRMTDLRAEGERQTYRVGEPICCHFHNETKEDELFRVVLNKPDYAVQWGRFLTEEEKDTGYCVFPAVETPGRYTLIALARNEYGIYTSPYCEVTVEEEGERDGTHQTKE